MKPKALRRGLAASVLATLGASCPSQAVAEEWLEVAKTADTAWEVKAGTYQKSQTKGGKEVAAALGRVREAKDKQIAFEKWYVSIDDCLQGYGKLVTLTPGGEYKYETDFVQKGGSIASAIADFLCMVYALDVKARDDKSL